MFSASGLPVFGTIGDTRFKTWDLKVYKWQPERIVLVCQCGQRLSLTASTTSCVECGRDHALAVKGISTDGRQSDQTLHPWRYYYYSEEDREDDGLPF